MFLFKMIIDTNLTKMCFDVFEEWGQDCYSSGGLVRVKTIDMIP